MKKKGRVCGTICAYRRHRHWAGHLNGSTLARDSARQAQTERQTIRVGDRVFSPDGLPQAVWLAGRRMAVLGAPALDNLLSDRLWVWSAATA